MQRKRKYQPKTTRVNDEEIKADMENRTPKGWYGLSTPPGWWQIVRDLHLGIVEQCPDYEIFQIKEKFAELRYYCSVEADPSVSPLIEEAEQKCAKTCQVCGESGSIVTTRGWASIRCRRPSHCW